MHSNIITPFLHKCIILSLSAPFVLSRSNRTIACTPYCNFDSLVVVGKFASRGVRLMGAGV